MHTTNMATANQPTFSQEVRLYPPQKEKLRQIANKTGLSVAAIIRILIDEAEPEIGKPPWLVDQNGVLIRTLRRM